MSFNTGPSSFLPFYEKLNYKFKEYGEAYENLLAEIYAENADILDVHTEFSHDHNFQDYYTASRVIAEAVLGDESKEAVAVTYRGLLFGKQVVDLVYEKAVAVNLKKLSRYVSDPSPAEALFGDVDKFLLENKAVDRFVTNNQRRIDDGRGLNQLAEATLGITLLIAEEARNEQFRHNYT